MSKRSPVGALGLAAFLIVLPLRGQELVGPEDRFAAIAERIRAAVRPAVERGEVPAVSIALVDDQRIVWAEGFGLADPDGKVPADAGTIYRVGSVSKLFTALAALRMVEQGKLDLDEPVSTYLADFNPRNKFGKPITLRHLMSHRSGLVRESPVGNYFDGTAPTIEATVRSLNATDLVHEPGTKTKYSNAAVAVVGRVVEVVAGRPFAEHVREEILRPLGMNASDFEHTTEVGKRLARAKMWTYEGREWDAPDFALGTLPAGNLYSTVLDLGRFLSALFAGGGPVVRPETLGSMMEIQFAGPEAKAGYGLGFSIGTFDAGDGKEPRKRFGHGGAVYGFSTDVIALPDEKLGAIVVASRDCTNGAVHALADYALKAMVAGGEPGPAEFLDRSADQAGARSWEGRYADGETGVDLWFQAGELRAMELRGGSEKRLDLVGEGEAISRPVLDDGRLFGLADGLVVKKEAGGLTVGEKLLRPIATPLPPAPPESWAGLIGEYGPDHNILYILERDGKLFTLIEWLFLYPLEELGPDRFAFPDWGMYHGEELLFERDAQGRATRVIAASVSFDRRSISGEGGETFTVVPLRPVDELRPAALAARPPAESSDLRKSDLVELTTLDPTIRLDIRYATDNNFLASRMYTQARAFMQRPAAEALVRVHKKLEEQGFGLLIHDAYRPWSVTKLFYDATPEESRGFVANPRSGSKHNRGCAVDLTLFDRATGAAIPMVAGYDEFSDRAAAFYPGGTSRQRWHRAVLRRAMESEGFDVISNEWWHFDFKDWRSYGIQNIPFDSIPVAQVP
jgi:CubicO group peptidase (beta-lactamase class C family)/D-alanyl-D-alanine dipeptidase